MPEVLPPMPKIRFPRLQRVELTGFSLYSRTPAVSVTLNPGVVCFAGANGIGKSTLLAAINYGLTGAVPHPDRHLKSKQGYYRDARDFTPRFFEGRIDELDRDLASVGLTFVLGGYSWELVRGIFDGSGLRSFKLTSLDNGQADPQIDSLNEAQRQVQYERRLVDAMGLGNIEQAMLLLHFLLTFDEGRNLLFWNAEALEVLLQFAFGETATHAHEAENLRRQAEKLGSLARNYRWQATTLRGRLATLEEAFGTAGDGPSPDDEALLTYRGWLEERERLEGELVRAEEEVRSATAGFADIAAEVSSLRANYDRAFSDAIRAGAGPAQHPIVARLMAEHLCEICGSSGTNIAEQVSGAIARHRCPLCGTPVPDPEPRLGDLEILRELDGALGEAITKQSAFAQQRARRIVELQELKDAVGRLEEQVSGFEKRFEYAATIARRERGGGQSGQDSINALRTALRKTDEDAETTYAQRDQLLAQLREINLQVQRRYHESAHPFLESFQRLAGGFLGMPVDVELRPREANQVTLEFTLNREPRRQEHNLSESQRFFVDIALRMSFAQFISALGEPVTLLIDTPEGSLDIAYEQRAGEMFAAFAHDNNILMTANVNTSRLLLALAELAGPARMTLVRMTDWAELNAVQSANEGLFQSAYDQIAGRLAHSEEA